MDNFEIVTFQVWMMILEDFIPVWSSPSVTTLLVSVGWIITQPWKYTSNAFCTGSLLVLVVAMATSWGGWFILSAFYWYFVACQIKKPSKRQTT